MLVAFTAVVLSQLAIAILLFGTLAIDRPEVAEVDVDPALTPAPVPMRPAVLDAAAPIAAPQAA